MKKFRLLGHSLLAVGLIVLMCLMGTAQPQRSELTNSPALAPFAVVELFTSHNVVRAFEVVPLTSMQGGVQVSLKHVENLAKASLIAYVQHSETQQVVGAQQYIPIAWE